MRRSGKNGYVVGPLAAPDLAANSKPIRRAEYYLSRINASIAWKNARGVPGVVSRWQAVETVASNRRETWARKSSRNVPGGYSYIFGLRQRLSYCQRPLPELDRWGGELVGLADTTVRLGLGKGDALYARVATESRDTQIKYCRLCRSLRWSR